MRRRLAASSKPLLERRQAILEARKLSNLRFAHAVNRFSKDTIAPLSANALVVIEAQLYDGG